MICFIENHLKQWTLVRRKFNLIGNYEEKEIAIFNGVITLIREGVEIHDMKVADIAIKANIGKGTLYNYFKTKEEIISKALLYMMEGEFYKTVEMVDAKEGFKNKFYAILEAIEESFKNTNSTINWIISNMQEKSIFKYISEDNTLFEKLRKQILKAMSMLCILGVKEGIIKPQEDQEYEYFVFTSVILTYSNCFCPMLDSNKIDVKKAKDNAYKLLIKAFN